jgi:hypothetical protein
MNIGVSHLSMFVVLILLEWGSLQSFRTFFCDGPIKEPHCNPKKKKKHSELDRHL